MKRWAWLVFWVGLPLLVGSGVGSFFQPGEWFEQLNRPAWDPPNWVFGPVWTVLYVMIAVAGWRIWRLRRTGGAMTAWWVQLGLNFLWSPVFFALQSPGWAIPIILAMIVSIVAFIRLAWDQDRIAAWLFVPYLAWVSYATLLNVSIWWLN